MPPKKRGHPDLEELLEREWCYYCEREFDDLAVLVSHQKAKHYKCERCNRRLNTIGGLQVHMSQVHKETLTSIENALPNRQDLGVEIFGMTGVPTELINQRKQRIIADYHQAQAARQAATGNPPPGSGGPNPNKKPKVEDKLSLKERLAAHRAAKKAAENDSGENTPASATAAAPSPGLPAEQTPVSPYPTFPTQASPPASFPQPYAAPSQPGYGGFPAQAPPFMPPVPSPTSVTPLQSFPMHPHAAPYSPNGHTYPLHPVPFAAGSPPPGSFQQPRHASPNQVAGIARPPSLPAGPPGLPQKPAFAPPPVNQFQMQQMHQGFYANQQRIPHESPANGHNVSASGSPAPIQMIATNADIDELVANAANQSRATQDTGNSVEGKVAGATDAAEGAEKKVAKKEKEKKINMIYSDNEVSPEEKMAMLPRYNKYFGLAQTREATTLHSSVEMTAGFTGAVGA